MIPVEGHGSLGHAAWRGQKQEPVAGRTTGETE